MGRRLIVLAALGSLACGRVHHRFDHGDGLAAPDGAGGESVDLDLVSSPVLIETARLCAAVADLDARYPCAVPGDHECWPRDRRGGSCGTAASPASTDTPGLSRSAGSSDIVELLRFCRVGAPLTSYVSARDGAELQETFRRWERIVRGTEQLVVPRGVTPSTTSALPSTPVLCLYDLNHDDGYVGYTPRAAFAPVSLDATSASGGSRGLLTGSIDELAVGLTEALEERARAELEMWAAESLHPLLCTGPNAPGHFLRNTCALLREYQSDGGTRPRALSWATLRDALENDVRRLPEAIATSDVLPPGPAGDAVRIALLLVAELRESTDPAVLIGRLAERLAEVPGIDPNARLAVAFIRLVVALAVGPAVPEQALVGIAATLFLDFHSPNELAAAWSRLDDAWPSGESAAPADAWNLTSPSNEDTARNDVLRVVETTSALRELLPYAETLDDALGRLCGTESTIAPCDQRDVAGDLVTQLHARLDRIGRVELLLAGECASDRDEGGGTRVWRAAHQLLREGSVGDGYGSACHISLGAGTTSGALPALPHPATTLPQLLMGLLGDGTDAALTALLTTCESGTPGSCGGREQILAATTVAEALELIPITAADRAADAPRLALRETLRGARRTLEPAHAACEEAVPGTCGVVGCVGASCVTPWTGPGAEPAARVELRARATAVAELLDCAGSSCSSEQTCIAAAADLDAALACVPLSRHGALAEGLRISFGPGGSRFVGRLLGVLRELRATIAEIEAARNALAQATDASQRDEQIANLLGHFVRALELSVRFITEDESFAVPHSIPTLIRAIASGEVAPIVAAAIDLLADVGELVGFDETSLRALTFAGQIVRAETSDEVRDAVTAFAAPVGSYRHKRFDRGPRLYLNGLVGFVGSFEHYFGRVDPDQLLSNGSLGAHVSLGFHLNLVGDEAAGTFGLYVPVIDVSPFATFVPDSQVRADEVDPLSILAPGMYLWWGFLDTPLVLAGGVSFVPRGRSLTYDAVAGDTLSSRVDVFRLQLILGVDVTLLPF